jgi:uncharacterized membrane protein YkoI
MNDKLKAALIAVVAVVALAVGGTAVAGAVGGDDDGTEKPITGPALQQASKAAVDHLGGGDVTDTELGDEEGYYEVEVTRGDGSQVDVHLNRGFDVVSTEGDSDTAEDGS